MKSRYALLFLFVLITGIAAKAQAPCQAAINIVHTGNNSVNISNPVAGLPPNTWNNFSFGVCSGWGYSSSGPSQPNSFVVPCMGLLPGLYYVCLTISDSAAGCMSHVCDTVHISGPGCATTFSLSPDSANIHNDWLNVTTNMDLYSSFRWNWGDGTPQDTCKTAGPWPSHSYAVPGHYQICVSVLDSNCNFKCTSSFCDSITVTAAHINTVNVRTAPVQGIGEYKILENWSLFPNPSSGSSQFSYNLRDEAEVEICLFNLQGQKVRMVQNRERQMGGTHLSEINTSDLDPGTYLIRIQTGVQSVTTRLMVEH